MHVSYTLMEELGFTETCVSPNGGGIMMHCQAANLDLKCNKTHAQVFVVVIEQTTTENRSSHTIIRRWLSVTETARTSDRLCVCVSFSWRSFEENFTWSGEAFRAICEGTRTWCLIITMWYDYVVDSYRTVAEWSNVTC